ncbi:hypothetical protein Dda_3768 [Drechslerella dactyloides]|uniref:Uncharacterized protein n=1 Tax=Drechslerella dactyloides TaxID=74499 RepID=A0AAD6IYJ0_DREDA|nr:hypothetical protein Dda_3768 [Drechslerella dactyloides]
MQDNYFPPVEMDIDKLLAADPLQFLSFSGGPSFERQATAPAIPALIPARTGEIATQDVDQPNLDITTDLNTADTGDRTRPHDEIQNSLPGDDDPLFNRKFLIAAGKAHKKLLSAVQLSSCSSDLSDFVYSLYGLEDIIRIGFDALESILDGNILSTLRDIYCFLHVAYAISRVDKNAKDEDLPFTDFRDDLHVFKLCLSSQPEASKQRSERDVFDEIVKLTWREFQSVDCILGRSFSNALSRNVGPQGGVRGLGSLATTLNVEDRLGSTLYSSRKRDADFLPDCHHPTMDNAARPISSQPQNSEGGSQFSCVFSTTIVQDVVRIANKIEPLKLLQMILASRSRKTCEWTKDMNDAAMNAKVPGCVFCCDPRAYYLSDSQHEDCPTCLDAFIKFITNRSQPSAFNNFLNKIRHLATTLTRIPMIFGNCVHSICRSSWLMSSPGSNVPDMQPSAVDGNRENRERTFTARIEQELSLASSDPPTEKTEPDTSTSTESSTSPVGQIGIGPPGLYKCLEEDCNAPPFKTEQSRYYHWVNVHDPDARQIKVTCGFGDPMCISRTIGWQGKGQSKAVSNMRTHKNEKKHWRPEEGKDSNRFIIEQISPPRKYIIG